MEVEDLEAAADLRPLGQVECRFLAVVSAGGLGVAAAGFGAIGAMNLIVARELAANGQ